MEISESKSEKKPMDLWKDVNTSLYQVNNSYYSIEFVKFKILKNTFYRLFYNRLMLQPLVQLSQKKCQIKE